MTVESSLISLYYYFLYIHVHNFVCHAHIYYNKSYNIILNIHNVFIYGL